MLATFTLAVAPKPDVYRVFFHSGMSQTPDGEWVRSQGEPLTPTVGST